MKSKNYSRNFIIPLVIYPFDLMISVAETEEQLGVILNKYISEEETEWKWDNKTAEGRCCIFTTNQGLIRLRKKPITNTDYAVLQHEIFHYTMHIFRRIGMTWCVKSDEAYSYMIQYLTDKIYSQI